MFLQRTEQFHDFLLKEFAYCAQRICPTRSDGFQAVNIRQSCDLSGSALDREHLFDLVRLAAVDGRLPRAGVAFFQTAKTRSPNETRSDGFV